MLGIGRFSASSVSRSKRFSVVILAVSQIFTKFADDTYILNMAEAIPKLKPLREDFNYHEFTDFLKSNDFHRMCISSKIDDFWDACFKKAEQERSYYAMGMDVQAVDSEDGFTIALNYIYENYPKETFFNFVIYILEAYTNWRKKDLHITEFKKDLSILGAPKEFITQLEKLSSIFSNSVPRSTLPDNILNSEKLEDVLRKMDDSIKNGDYNLTLTYAYTSLEGLFKSFIKENIPEKESVDKINQMSKIVREYIKSSLENGNKKYSDEILNLITTMTNAVSNARNEFSDSHFDKSSDKWLADFSRDCVNSVGRLLLNFIT
jgi:hypothetical protein